jgi:hypothetical protein
VINANEVPLDFFRRPRLEVMPLDGVEQAVTDIVNPTSGRTVYEDLGRRSPPRPRRGHRAGGSIAVDTERQPTPQPVPQDARCSSM